MKDPNIKTWRDGSTEYEFDKLTGVTTRFDYLEHDDAGKVRITRHQDIEPILTFAHTKQKDPDPVNTDGLNHYACVPVLGQYEMLRDGIDMARDPKAAIEWINRKHPEYRVTDRWHDDKRARNRSTKIIVK